MFEGGEISKKIDIDSEIKHYEDQITRLRNMLQTVKDFPESEEKNSNITWMNEQINHHQGEIEKLKRRKNG